MSSGGHSTQQGQLNQDNGWAQNALGGYNSDIGNFTSNVNSTLAAGNPYQSKQYLQNQNLETSGAMNSENTREGQQLRDSARRSGTNTAAIAGTMASSAREGQRDLTQYNAGRDTANEDKWIGLKQGLMKDQLEGANSEAGVYGTSMGGANSSLNALTSRENAMDEMWGNLAGSVVGAGGTVGAAALNN